MRSEGEIREVLKGFKSCKEGEDCFSCPSNMVCNPFNDETQILVKLLEWVLGE